MKQSARSATCIPQPIIRNGSRTATNTSICLIGGESRGAGGIFFDHLKTNLADSWLFQQDLADALMGAYAPLVEAHASDPINDHQQAWLHHRRGRYAEFNLAWDRGTRFGLETGGRAESILASLPPVVTWSAYPEPAIGSPERAWLDVVRGAPRDWA